jgi:hypothetical protein
VAPRKEARRILQEDQRRINAANGFNRCRPLVPGVIGAEHLSGKRKGLTGKSRRNNVNHSPIFAGVTHVVERVNIPEDRGGMQITVSDSGFEDFLAIGFEFDIAERSPVQQVLRRKVSTPSAGE